MSNSKIVRFYEPVKVNKDDKVVAIGKTFWTTLLDKMKELGDSPDDRTFTYAGVDYVGEERQALKPARRYLYAGRLRDKDDWPDSYEPASGQVSPLSLPGLLLEPTFLVPFGSNNFCAVMTPRLGGTRTSALERWLTGACGLLATTDRIELRPLIEKNVANKLNNVAVGATTLSVRFKKGVDFGDDTGGGEVGAAMRHAAEGVTEDMSAEIRLSFGHGRGKDASRKKLLQAARWVAQRSYADKANVSMLIPRTDSESNEVTERSESHDLLKDRITYQVPMEVPAGQALTELSVMSAIEVAIERFNAEH